MVANWTNSLDDYGALAEQKLELEKALEATRVEQATSHQKKPKAASRASGKIAPSPDN